MELWANYHAAFAEAEATGLARRPTIPADCTHNAHIYYLLLPSAEQRTAFISALKEQGIHTVFHYVPLHSSPYGQKIGRVVGPMDNTDSLSERLVRLPLWLGLEEIQSDVIDRVVDVLKRV